MENLFIIISKFLNSSTSIIEHTELTQKNITKENTILWNPNPSLIDIETYEEFKSAMKKRSWKYYNLNYKISQTDFCIALLSCTEYSLNHTVTDFIEARTFTGAWRNIETVFGTSTNKVSSWIEKYISSRTATGYCNSLGITLDNTIPQIISTSNLLLYKENEDSQILSTLTKKDKVTEVKRYSTTNKVLGVSNIMFDSSLVPESHLYDLFNAHLDFGYKNKE